LARASHKERRSIGGWKIAANQGTPRAKQPVGRQFVNAVLAPKRRHDKR
jgi:hypothetical protein